MRAVFYDHILDGSEATEQNAEEHARGLDWQGIGKQEQEIPYLRFHKKINGVNIWYNIGTDSYIFSDPDAPMMIQKYYAPSDSYEFYNEETAEWFNRAGQQIRPPEEYENEIFGDE